MIQIQYPKIDTAPFGFTPKAKKGVKAPNNWLDWIKSKLLYAEGDHNG